MLSNEFLADPESESGAADAFGAEEGVKNHWAYLSGHSGAVISNGQDDSFGSGSPVGCIAASKQEAAAEGHGVDGISEQIADDLTNLAFKTQDGAGDAFAPLHEDSRIEKPALIEKKRFFKQLRASYVRGIGRLLIEAKRLMGDC